MVVSKKRILASRRHYAIHVFTQEINMFCNLRLSFILISKHYIMVLNERYKDLTIQPWKALIGTPIDLLIYPAI